MQVLWLQQESWKACSADEFAPFLADQPQISSFDKTDLMSDIPHLNANDINSNASTQAGSFSALEWPNEFGSPQHDSDNDPGYQPSHDSGMQRPRQAPRKASPSEADAVKQVRCIAG